MEQMYLIEILINKVTIFASDQENSADKKLIIKIKFGPKVDFVIREGQLAKIEQTKDDIIESDENGRRKWSRTIRVGKSYLFPSYPDTILMILSKFPLEIEIYNDDDKETDIFIGVGTMHWDTNFFHMLKDTKDACKVHQPLTIKQSTPLFGECYCKQVGEIDFILRLSALGESIITEFQQLMSDPESFVFRTNKAPSMFRCKRIENDDPNFCMVGSLYETTTLEDPTFASNATQKVEICTDLQSCGLDQEEPNVKCTHGQETRKSYPVDKIRMGDITGPCGNVNCPLVHKVKTYIRSLDCYKKENILQKCETKKENKEGRVCGTCICKDDRMHRENCPTTKGTEEKTICSGCKGVTNVGETCIDNINKMYGTGATPKTSQTKVSYVGCAYSMQYTIQNMNYSSDVKSHINTNYSCSSSWHSLCGDKSKKVVSQTRSTCSLNDGNIYNFEVSESKRKFAVLNVEISNNKECQCSPPKEPPACKAPDCHCVAKAINKAARKAHKPYCPSYKHKENCPVTLITEEHETKKVEDDENDAEPLPYGLPPIKLGPCPVLGRPCTVPDGFARMYKTAAIPPQPPSYSDAGKICCSKEFERIKTVLKEYMKVEEQSDFRCFKKFNEDTEKRCCDKEQKLFSLTGKDCCGKHKLALQDKYKDNK